MAALSYYVFSIIIVCSIGFHSTFLNFFKTKNPVPEGAGFFGNAKEEIETKGKYEKENKNS